MEYYSFTLRKLVALRIITTRFLILILEIKLLFRLEMFLFLTIKQILKILLTKQATISRLTLVIALKIMKFLHACFLGDGD